MEPSPLKPPAPRTRLGERVSYYREFADAGTIGIQFVLCLVAGFAVGRWVDAKWFHAQGTATLIGAVIGVAAAFRSLWHTARKIQKRMASYAEDREKALLGESIPEPKKPVEEDDKRAL